MTADAEVPSRPRPEIRALTGLRIVAAVWVLTFHLGFTDGAANWAFWRELAPVTAEGAVGVDLFYVLSGFVITLTYLEVLGPRPGRRAAVTFWWARICRIWPVYALVTTLFGGWLLVRSSGGGPVAYQTVQPVLDGWHYLEQLAMVQLWHRPFFDGSSWVGPAWSISAEWLAYACFPLLALLLWRLRAAPAVVTGVLATGCLVPFAWLVLETGSPYHPWSWLLRIGGGFLAGALTCLAVRRLPPGPRTERAASVVAGLAAAAVVAGLFLLPAAGAPDGRDRPMAVVVLFPALVGGLALSGRGLGRLLGSRAAVHGGRISYALYLVHVPLLEIAWTATAALRRAGAAAVWSALVVGAAVPVAFLLAHLLHTRVEEPARVALRSRGPGRALRRGAGLA